MALSLMAPISNVVLWPGCTIEFAAEEPDGTAISTTWRISNVVICGDPAEQPVIIEPAGPFMLTPGPESVSA